MFYTVFKDKLRKIQSSVKVFNLKILRNLLGH